MIVELSYEDYKLVRNSLSAGYDNLQREFESIRRIVAILDKEATKEKK